MQSRLESTRVGRLLISVLIVATVAGLVIWNLPGSKLRNEGLRATGPYMRAVGLDQNWSVFAPDPYRESFFLSARVTDADGSQHLWEVPEGNDVIGAYWDFRWGKWAEWTVAGNQDLCRGTVGYVANREADAGREAAHVDLVVRRRANSRPGVEPSRGPWEEKVICKGRIGEPESQ